MTSSKYRRACGACKKRHLKCDLQYPCTACSEAGKRCIGAQLFRFRNNEDPDIKSGAKKRPKKFPEDQRWTTIPKRLEYIFETEGLSIHVSEDTDEEEIPAGPSAIHVGKASSACPLDFLLLQDVEQDGNRQIHTPQRRFEETNTPLSSVIPVSNNATTPFTSTRAIWPVSTKEEAMLLRHFLNELSIWFDHLDKDKHFSTVVVQAAATSPALHFAILAISSKHLSLTRNFDRFAPDNYQHECLEVLIPALSDPDALLDENLFAATIILRVFDEMTERSEHETGTHLIGSHMIVNARERARSQPPATTTPSSLRSAVLRIELRQEIHIAFIMNRPPSPLVQYCNIDRTLNPTDDWEWAYRVIAHTADVLTYCNDGDAKRGGLRRWEELVAYLGTWEGMVPASFSPFYEEVCDVAKGKIFPDLLFANDCHAGGHQYLAMSKIALLAHDPRIPLLGPDRLRDLKVRDTEIKSQVIRICAIALSNPHFSSLTFAAGVAIATCGERFAARAEQEALMRILVDSEAHMAWHSLRASERLRSCWGWGR